LKIAIDISQIVYGTGVSVYTRKLIETLLTLDRENEYVLFAGAFRRRQEILEAFPNSKVFPIPPIAADFIWNRLHTFPIEKLIGEVDVLHTSDWSEPPSSSFKVTTVHDLYPLKSTSVKLFTERVFLSTPESWLRLCLHLIGKMNMCSLQGLSEGVRRFWKRFPTPKFFLFRRLQQTLSGTGFTPFRSKN